MNKARIIEIIAKIKSLAEEDISTVIWIYTSAGEGGIFHIRHSKTRGAIFPERQIRLNLIFEEKEELSRALSVQKEHTFIEKRGGGIYQEELWWSPTCITGATWHSTMWTDECVGAESDFIITGLPLGVYEDMNVAINLAKESLTNFSCETIDDLTREKIIRTVVQSKSDLDYIQALLQKAEKLGVSPNELLPLKNTLKHKTLEWLITHEIPWRFIAEQSHHSHINDIPRHINEAIKICNTLQETLPKKMRDHIVVYCKIIVSQYENEVKKGKKMFWWHIYNREEYERYTIKIKYDLEELEKFIKITSENELLERFYVVKALKIHHWREKGKEFYSLRGKISSFVKRILHNI